MGSLQRSKKFMSIDSLYYEEERLNTFINWPVTFLSPRDLAANGFYYLRTKDHCACAFCRGIVGAWEEGDTPEQEHQRHFPKCPLVLGLPTSNVPLVQGRILVEANLHKSSVEQVANDVAPTEPEDPSQNGIDVCGRMETSFLAPHMVTVCKAGEPATSVPLGEFGLKPQHQGSQRPDFMKNEARRRSFAAWPETVQVSVDKLVEAGFYYIGLSDHVRCYYCGNGLRNWEDNDDPWVEHARWYPSCQYVLLKKGATFVEKVQDIFPPFRHTPPNEPSAYYTGSTGKRNVIQLSVEQLDNLMKLEVAQALINQGFPDWAIRGALKEKVEESGVPFLMLAEAVDKTLHLLAQRDGDKWQELSVSSKKWLNQLASHADATNVVENPTLSIPPAHTRFENSNLPANSVQEKAICPSANFDTTVSSSEERFVEASSLSVEPPREDIPAIELQANHSLGEDVSPGTSSQPVEMLSGESTPSQSEHKSGEISDPLKEADVVMETAAKILSKEPTTNTGHQVFESHQNQIGSKEKLLQELMSEETERRDTRTCRVCMDGDLEVVFLPCTHMVSCSSCALALTSCPICRGTISYALRPIMS